MDESELRRPVMRPARGGLSSFATDEELLGRAAVGAVAEAAPVREPVPAPVAAPETASPSAPDTAADPESEDRLPTIRDWREPIVFDVFEPDGRYLGQVSAPPGFLMSPLPAIRGNTVWAAVKSSGGVPDIVRFEIER